MANTMRWTLPSSRSSSPPFMSKTQNANTFDQIAVLLELDGANRFKVIAYQNASRALATLEEDLLIVVKENRVTDIKGIGKGIGGLISEAVLNGSWGNLGELYDKIPPGLIEMTGIPSLGPKRVRLLYEELNIDSLTLLIMGRVFELLIVFIFLDL